MIELLVYGVILFIVGVGATILWDRYKEFEKGQSEQRRVLRRDSGSKKIQSPNGEVKISYSTEYSDKIKQIEEKIKKAQKEAEKRYQDSIDWSARTLIDKSGTASIDWKKFEKMLNIFEDSKDLFEDND